MDNGNVEVIVTYSILSDCSPFQQVCDNEMEMYNQRMFNDAGTVPYAQKQLFHV
jgi:hypothetical protein